MVVNCFVCHVFSICKSIDVYITDEMIDGLGITDDKFFFMNNNHL
jgi:hypothetical protein